jgi:hypothetical protein
MCTKSVIGQRTVASEKIPKAIVDEGLARLFVGAACLRCIGGFDQKRVIHISHKFFGDWICPLADAVCLSALWNASSLRNEGNVLLLSSFPGHPLPPLWMANGQGTVGHFDCPRRRPSYLGPVRKLSTSMPDRVAEPNADMQA